MYHLKHHGIPVEQTDGHSSYIRLRLILDRFPSALDIGQYAAAAEHWLQNCKDGKYCGGKKMNILSFRTFQTYRSPAFEVDFDIINEPPQIIDELIEKLRDVSQQESRTAHLEKAIVAYYHLP